MFDISKQKVSVKCGCGRNHQVTLKDVTTRRTVRCSCGVNIQLEDGNGSVKRSISDTNKSFNDLEKVLRRFGR